LTGFVAVTSQSQSHHVARSSQGRHKVVAVASQSQRRRSRNHITVASQS